MSGQLDGRSYAGTLKNFQSTHIGYIAHRAVIFAIAWHLVFLLNTIYYCLGEAAAVCPTLTGTRRKFSRWGKYSTFLVIFHRLLLLCRFSFFWLGRRTCDQQVAS